MTRGSAGMPEEGRGEAWAGLGAHHGEIPAAGRGYDGSNSRRGDGSAGRGYDGAVFAWVWRIGEALVWRICETLV